MEQGPECGVAASVVVELEILISKVDRVHLEEIGAEDGGKHLAAEELGGVLHLGLGDGLPGHHLRARPAHPQATTLATSPHPSLTWITTGATAVTRPPAEAFLARPPPSPRLRVKGSLLEITTRLPAVAILVVLWPEHEKSVTRVCR